jgi:hypothetical protein
MQQVQQAFGGAMVMLLAQSGIADAPIGIPTRSDSSPGSRVRVPSGKKLITAWKAWKCGSFSRADTVPEIGDKR